MKKFLIASLAIILALGMIGSAFAYFTDTATTSGNSFTAGTMELEIKDANETWSPACNGTWMLNNIEPGADQAGIDKITAAIDLRRVGSVTPDHLEILAVISIDENWVESDTDPSSTANEMAAKLKILVMTYGGQDLLNDNILNWNVDGNPAPTLNDLTYPPELSGLDNLGLPGAKEEGLSTPFSLKLQWIQGLDDNDFQGDILTANIYFTLNQHASQ